MKLFNLSSEPTALRAVTDKLFASQTASRFKPETRLLPHFDDACQPAVGATQAPGIGITKVFKTGIAVLSMLVPAVSAFAQDFPSRPIKMVIPYAAGGSVDMLGRAIADRLQAKVGQSVVPDNRVGANGTIAHQFVATSAPDGYTIGMSGTSPLVLAPHQFKGLKYDPLKDFTYLTCAGTTTFVLDVPASLPVKTVQELVAYAKANPGKLSFGSSGLGNSAHLAGELFKQVTGIDMVHVPYKGNAPAMADLIGGQIQVLFDPIQTSLAQIKAGKVRGLAVTSTTRLAQLPGVPTIAESGFPSYEFVVWFAVVGPAAMPAPVVKRLNTEINMLLQEPQLKTRFADLGADLTGTTVEACTAQVHSELARYGVLFDSLGMKPE